MQSTTSSAHAPTPEKSELPPASTERPSTKLLHVYDELGHVHDAMETITFALHSEPDGEDLQHVAGTLTETMIRLSAARTELDVARKARKAEEPIHSDPPPASASTPRRSYNRDILADQIVQNGHELRVIGVALRSAAAESATASAKFEAIHGSAALIPALVERLDGLADAVRDLRETDLVERPIPYRPTEPTPKPITGSRASEFRDCTNQLRDTLERLLFGARWLHSSIPGLTPPDVDAKLQSLEATFVIGFSELRALEEIALGEAS